MTEGVAISHQVAALQRNWRNGDIGRNWQLGDVSGQVSTDIHRYLEWNDENEYYHLCASLEGAAGQVPWEPGPQATTDSIIRLLQTRFGTKLQAERFKAELRAIRRGPAEPLQHLSRPRRPSATAFVEYVSACRSTHRACYHRRSSLPGGCCICLEQSAGDSTFIAVIASFPQ